MSPSPIVAALIPSNTCLAVVINEIDVECVALFADRGSGPCQIRTGPGCPSQRGTVQVLSAGRNRHAAPGQPQCCWRSQRIRARSRRVGWRA